MKIKCVYQAIGLLMAVLLLAGCGTDWFSKDERPVMELALREGTYADVVSRSVRQFEEENHVRCRIHEMSEEELHSAILREKEQKTGSYDLYMVDGSWMAEYAQKGVLSDLSDLGYGLDGDLITATTRICYRRGHLYLAPYYGNVTVLLYNKLILKKAGYEPDEINSFSDVMEICRYAQRKGNLGFMYRGDSNNNIVVDFLPILASAGGWVVDEKNDPTVDTPEFRQAMDFYLKLIETGKAESRDNLTIAIANNAAAMAVGWPGWYTPGRNATADYSAISGRMSDDGEEYKANIYGVWTLGIPQNAKDKEMSAKLLACLMDQDVQKKSIDYGGVPCRYSCLKDPAVLEKYPQYKAVERALEQGIYRPIMVEWPKFYEILGEEMGKIISGEKTTEEGLAEAQRRLEKMKEDL